MGTPRSKPYHHGDLRRALIAAGIDLLGEGGATALDLRKVTRKAGVSHAAPYRHFEDKRALLAAIAEDGFLRLAEQLRNAVNDAEPDSQVLALARAYIKFALAEPALTREMFSGLSIDRLAYPSLYAASKAAFGILQEAVEHEQATGAFIEDDPAKLVIIIWSMFHGLAVLLLENQIPMIAHDPDALAEATEQYVTSLYNGLRPR